VQVINSSSQTIARLFFFSRNFPRRGPVGTRNDNWFQELNGD
jgi:hypothetical protein